MRALLAALVLLPLCAGAMEPLSDSALSRVRAGDGMSFNFSNFSISGDATLRYFNAANTASLSIGNLSASRSDNSDAPFADPYTIDITSGGSLADIITLARPQNLTGKEIWQIAYDFGVNDQSGGSVVIKDLAYYGGGYQWSTPRSGDGLAWGYALRADVGSLALQPGGRLATGEALVLAHIRIGAANADGTVSDSPWRIADISNQPGIFNARTDDSGKSSLHFGISWPDAQAPIGAVSVDNITFRSAVTGDVNIGSSRIGGIQIQYLDVKFRQ